MNFAEKTFYKIMAKEDLTQQERDAEDILMMLMSYVTDIKNDDSTVIITAQFTGPTRYLKKRTCYGCIK